MATVSELTYDISIEFPIKRKYQQISLIEGDDVTLRVTQPSEEDWITPGYNMTVYDQNTRATLGSTPFNATVTELTLDNFAFDTKRALLVIEERIGEETKATGTTTFTNGANQPDFVQISFDDVIVEYFVLQSDTLAQIAEKTAIAINNDSDIGITATASGSQVTFTAKQAGKSENTKTVIFNDGNSIGVTVSANPSLSGGTDYLIDTYKTIAHLNFKVFEGGKTIFQPVGFFQYIEENGDTMTLQYYQSGFEV